ncbi:MAG: S41 family peptidase, partial [Rhodanobacteraceae bacterium]
NTDRDPVWIGNTVYFLSDRDEHLNLYSYDTSGGQIRQLTNYKGADARWASGDADGRIVFEVDGALHLYDTKASQDQALDITVPSDLVSTRASERSVKDQLESAALSANGKRALFVARGDVFSVPLEHGISIDLTHTPGAHERDAVFSHDGKRIAYISDESGEDAIWVRDADGSKAHQLTTETFGRLYRPIWSPDGTRIAFVDKDSRLHIVASAGGPAPVIADDPGVMRPDYTWSPGGHYLAFTLTDATTFETQLYVRDFAAGTNTRVGNAMFDSYGPSFSPDGKYLYFIADREWAPQISQIEWDFAANRPTGVYALALRKGLDNPFSPRNDSAAAEDKDADDNKDADKHGKKKPKEPASINDHIDFSGLDARLIRVPIDPDNIDIVVATDKALIYRVSDAPYYGRKGAFKPKVMAYSFKERKDKQVYEGADQMDVSADGGTLLVQDGKEYKRIDLGDNKPEAKAVKLDGLYMLVDPKAEYAEIFHEVWRRYRDYFYAANMNGYDWEALRKKYAALLPDVGDRSDLNYLLGQMVAELSNSHSYVGGGDLGLPDKPHVGLIGARFALDAASGHYRISRILQGENDEERYRSPLTEVGVDVHEGDYVLAINGRPLTAADNPYRLLRIAPGQLVQLTVNSQPDSGGAREVVVKPIDNEQPLNYHAWVAHNRDYVTQASNGAIGYLHIPDMGGDGIREFIKWYYPQLRKQGLIVDVRDNGGGNVSAMIIERLSRKLLGLDYGRAIDLTGTYPQQTFLGHLAALCNGTTASDGDIFSYMFKQAKLGPLIGTRTWGGVVGINNWGPLIDGGDVYVPQFATANTEGKYVIEGHGVDPDIEVKEDVSAELNGRDPQLDRAISELQKEIAAHPVKLPPAPPEPVKAPQDMRPASSAP